MSEKYYAMYDSKEKEYALPAGYLKHTAKIESAHNPTVRNPRSSAKGLFQFIDSTAAQYGVDALDPESSTDGAARLAADNAKVLKKVLNREPTAGELYLAHQQGGGGAAKLLRNPDVPAVDVVGRKAVINNGGREDMTAQEFVNLWIDKFNLKKKIGDEVIDPELAEEEAIAKLPEQVERGEISIEQAEMLALDFNLSKNVLGLEPEDVMLAYEQGLLTDGQVDMYIDYRENPVWFRTKDIANSIQRGMLEGIDGIVNAINEPLNVILPESMQLPKSPLHNLRPESRLMTGDIVRELSSFMVPFSAASKAKAVVSSVNKIMSVPKIAALQKSHPLVYKAVESLVQGTIAGAAADYAAFNPADPGITNLLKHYDALPEFMEFMTTDPDDPAPYNRLRRVMEGAMLGAGLELVLSGFRGLKASLLKKHGGNPELIARELKEASEELSEAYDSVLAKEANKIDELDKAVETRSPKGATKDMPSDEIVPPKASEEVVPEAKGTTKVVADEKLTSPADGLKSNRDEQANRIFMAMSNDSTPVFHEDLITRMETHGITDANKLLKVIYRESTELMGKARKPRGWAEDEAGAKQLLKKEMKRNAELSGQPLRFAKKVFGKLKDASTHVHALNEFYTAYTKQLDSRIKDVLANGKFTEKLAVLEHIKLFQELQGIVYGVRAESGRLLNIYRKQFGSSRFDFSDMDADALLKLKDVSEKEVDAALNAFNKAVGTKGKMAVARNLGRLRTLKGILEYTQLNLLWSPLTHIGNITSQSTMVAWKTIHRTVAGAVMYGISGGDMRYLAEVGHWYMGMAQGLQDAFRGLPDAISGVGQVVRGRKTFEEYIKDPKIGLFFKTQLTGKPMMEALMKDGIMDMSDSALQATFRKIPIMGKPMGYIFRTPFNFLASVDDVFKSVGWNAEAYSRMYRKGAEQGLGEAELKKWMGRVGNEKQVRDAALQGASKDEMDKLMRTIGTENMPRDVIEEATYVMRDFTFQHPLKGVAADFENLLNNSAVGLVVRILAMPFYRIMVNLMRWVKNNSVAGVFGEQVMKELKEGGIQRAETISRVVTGTAMAASAFYLAGLGFVTGKLPKEARYSSENAGITDNSFWTGKRWVQMQRMEPLSTLISIGANIRTAFNRTQMYLHDEEAEIKLNDVVMGYVMAFADPVLNQTFMQSLKELMTMITDYERLNMAQWSKKQMEKAFPASTLFNFLQRQGDDEIIRTYGKKFEGINGALEVLNKHLDKAQMFPKRHSVYGTPVPMEEPIMWIYNTRQPTADPVAYEMFKIGCNIAPPANTYRRNNLDYDMSNAQYDEYLDIVSKYPIQDVLQTVIDSPIYQSIGDDATKDKILKRVVSNIRDAAKKQWLANSPDVQQELIQKAYRRADAILNVEASENPLNAIYHYQELLH